MKRSVLPVALVGLLALLAAPPALHAAAASNGIRVVVKGLRDNQGRVGCGLFKGPDGFPRERNKEFAGRWTPIHKQEAVCFFKGAPAGTYAVTVLDDENMDGKMDFGPLGMPKKGYGFSNNAPARLSPPTFDAASFKYDGQSSLTVPIDIVYPKL